MFGNFSEQFTKSAQPVANLMEMNAKALELMSKQQTLLFTGLMNDSVKLVENLSDQTELNGMLAAQSVFVESLRERITGASKTTYTELTGISEEMIKGGLNTAEKSQTATAPTSKVKAASAPKKPSTKELAKKATVKKAVVKKAVAAPASTKKSTATATAKTKTVAVANKETNKIVKSNASKAAVESPKVITQPVAKTMTKATPADVNASVEK